MAPSTASRGHRLLKSARTAGALLAVVVLAVARAGESAPPGSSAVEFVVTSDVHFGLHRGNFQGAVNVESRAVNAALVRTINQLPTVSLPADGGLKAGQPVGAVEFVAITGDLTNRQELYPLHIQRAADSWRQFETVWIGGLTLTDARGQPTPLLLVPGNHDASNAIGAPSRLLPLTDATSMVQIYNRMMRPATPRTPESYRYATDKIIYARDFGGVHGIFLTLWPDTAARAWIEQDLAGIPATTPVMLFTHDPPAADARHFTNPNGNHDVNGTDKFENVIADRYADGPAADGETTIEQRALAAFLKLHRNIVAYFHGHSNWNEFYTWTGPDGDVALPVFRLDSPMKGKISSKEETKLSFDVVVVDATAAKMTVRECLWNPSRGAGQASTPVAWGSSATISLRPRP